MSDLISREYMKSLGATCIASRSKDGTLFPIVAIDELPPAQPERLTDDDFETIRIHLNSYKEKLCNQQRWKEAEEYQHIIDRFMALASVQPERKRGKWRRRLVDSGFNADWHCSECGWKTSLEEHGYNFCPNCGCRMEEGDSE